VVRELAHRGFAVVVGYITNQVAADATVDEVLAAGQSRPTPELRRATRRWRR
jgi:hypothetical protein